MWILNIFKESLNGSFDYFLRTVKGRFLSFLILLIVSYLAVAVFTLLITVIVIPLLNQGQFSLDLLSFDGLFAWFRMIDPAWLVTVVIASNGLFYQNQFNQRMSFPDFFHGKSSSFWLELCAAVSLFSVILTIYYKNELLLTLADQTPLELLLAEGGENLGYTFSALISSWIYYVVFSLPVVAIIVIDTRERKRNGVTPSIPIWKVSLAIILLGYALYWTFDNFLYLFNELFLALVYIPFEMVEIPATLGIIATIFFKVLYFMMLSAVIHYTMKINESKEQGVSQEIIDEI